MRGRATVSLLLVRDVFRSSNFVCIARKMILQVQLVMDIEFTILKMIITQSTGFGVSICKMFIEVLRKVYKARMKVPMCFCSPGRVLSPDMIFLPFDLIHSILTARKTA